MQDLLPLQSQAYYALKEQIVSNKLDYDVIYSLTRIAKELGISRTPVKDAMTRLSNEKYIDVYPSKGFCLHKLSESDIANTYQIRSAFECYAAIDMSSSKTARATSYLKMLKNLVADMDKTVVRKDSLEKTMKCDSDFHSTLVHYLDNPEITNLFDSYAYNLQVIAMKTFKRPGRAADAVAEHNEIISAISSGDVARAYEAVRHHLAITKEIAREYYNV